MSTRRLSIGSKLSYYGISNWRKIQVDIDRDWGGLPVYNFTLKTNLSIPKDEFYSKKLKNEIHDKIDDVFSEYFPLVNKHTQYNLTGTWVGFIQDDEYYTIYI